MNFEKGIDPWLANLLGEKEKKKAQKTQVKDSAKIKYPFFDQCSADCDNQFWRGIFLTLSVDGSYRKLTTVRPYTQNDVVKYDPSLNIDYVLIHLTKKIHCPISSKNLEKTFKDVKEFMNINCGISCDSHFSLIKRKKEILAWNGLSQAEKLSFVRAYIDRECKDDEEKKKKYENILITGFHLISPSQVVFEDNEIKTISFE